MKKVYTAPKIYFESFTMSTNIAGDCETRTDNPTKGTCGYFDSSTNQVLFFSGISGCKAVAEQDSACYYLPSESTNLFNS